MALSCGSPRPLSTLRILDVTLEVVGTGIAMLIVRTIGTTKVPKYDVGGERCGRDLSGREARETTASAGRIDLYMTKALPPAARSHRQQISDVLNFSVTLRDSAIQLPLQCPVVKKRDRYESSLYKL
jgi:hypothetical protein